MCRGTMSFLITGAVLWLIVSALQTEIAYSAQIDRPTAAAFPLGTGSDVARTRCLTCHGADLVVQQRLPPDGWSRELDKMVAWGAVLTEAERLVLLNYLATHFAQTQSAMRDLAGDALVKARCEVCHDRTLIDQQRLTREGWAREIEKMAGWGAVVTESDETAIAEYLTARRFER